MHYRKVLYKNYFQNQAGRRATAITQQLQQDTQQLLADLGNWLPTNKDCRILEIGCGYGNLVQALQQQGYTNVQGIDISHDQVDMARKLGIKNIQQADIHDFLQKNTTQYDCIIGIDIIEHFTKNELVNLLALLKIQLSKHGQCLFRTPNMDAIGASLYAYGDFTHEVLLNTSSAKQLFQSLGFVQTKVYASHLRVQSWWKRPIQKILWQLCCVWARINIFASARSTKDIVFTPNIIIHAFV